MGTSNYSYEFKRDAVDQIRVRGYTNNGLLSPVDFETQQQKLNEAGV